MTLHRSLDISVKPYIHTCDNIISRLDNLKVDERLKTRENVDRLMIKLIDILDFIKTNF